jgi:hypothetical protein
MYGQYSESYVGRRTKADMMPATAIDAKVVGHNRIAINYPDGSRAYRLHRTDVVRVWPNGDIRLDDGGWPTMTTRRAMNQGLAYFGLDGRVFAVGKHGCHGVILNGKEYTFIGCIVL